MLPSRNSRMRSTTVRSTSGSELACERRTKRIRDERSLQSTRDCFRRDSMSLKSEAESSLGLKTWSRVMVDC